LQAVEIGGLRPAYWTDCGCVGAFTPAFAVSNPAGHAFWLWSACKEAAAENQQRPDAEQHERPRRTGRRRWKMANLVLA